MKKNKNTLDNEKTHLHSRSQTQHSPEPYYFHEHMADGHARSAGKGRVEVTTS